MLSSHFADRDAMPPCTRRRVDRARTYSWTRHSSGGWQDDALGAGPQQRPPRRPSPFPNARKFLTHGECALVAPDHSRYESLKRVSIGHRWNRCRGGVSLRRAGRDISRRRMIATSLAVARVGGGHAVDKGRGHDDGSAASIPHQRLADHSTCRLFPARLWVRLILNPEVEGASSIKSSKTRIGVSAEAFGRQSRCIVTTVASAAHLICSEDLPGIAQSVHFLGAPPSEAAASGFHCAFG